MAIKPIDIPCPVCAAQPGERCRYTHVKDRIGDRMRGSHSLRRLDAVHATHVASTLVGT